jgi:glycosyltransferase involved in cell wall biosynthesis
MVDWHARIQRSQQLARGLAALGYRVLFVNPHLGRQFDWPMAFDHSDRISFLEENIAEVHIRLAREPVFHERLLTSAESSRVAAVIRQVAQKANFNEVVQIVSLPIWMDAATQLRLESAWPVLYDCHDLLAGLPGMAESVVHAEQRALDVADRVICSSKDLLARYGSGGRAAKAVLLPNATGPAGEPSTAARAKSGSRTVAGYVGALSTWFDAASIERAAQMNPNTDFLLVGAVEERALRRLEVLSNVGFLGEVPHRDLPALFSQFDVALIPFRVNELTRATDPIKLYEYFSYGLPVISSRLPEVERFGDLVYVASNPEEFGAQVERALNESGVTLRERRLRIAEQETWLARARSLGDQIEGMLSASPLVRG